MAYSLSISVTADTAPMRAQMALAQDSARNLAKEMRQLAAAANAASGDVKAGYLAQLGRVASGHEAASASARRFSNEIKTALNPQHVERFNLAVRESESILGRLGGVAMAPLRSLQGSVVGLAETAVAAFSVGALVEWTKHAIEAAERTTNLAAAVGLAPTQFQELSAAMQIAGGDAEGSARTMERLAKNIGSALADPTGTSGRAFAALGITEKQLRENSDNLNEVLRLLADAFTSFKDSPTKTAAFMEILGRGMLSLIPALKQGGAGMDELKRRVEEVGGVLSAQTIKALADSAEKMNTLGVAATGLGSNLAAKLKPTIDAITDSLTGMIAALNRALNMSTPAAQLSDLSKQLEDVNGQIARLKSAAVGAPETPYTEMSGRENLELQRARRGGRSPAPGGTALVGAPNELATLEARAAALRDEIFGVGYAAREAAAAVDNLFIKPSVPPIEKPAKGGGKEGLAPIDAAFQLADSAAQAQIRIDAAYLAAFKFNQQAQVTAKTKTLAEALTADIAYTKQLAGQDQERLANAMRIADAIKAVTDADKAKKASDQLKVWEQQMQLSAHTAVQIAQDQAMLVADAERKAEAFRAAWAAPFKTAFATMESTFESAITGMIDRSKMLAETWADIRKSMTGAAISLAGSVASKGAASALFTDAAGRGIGDVLGDKLLSEIGLGASSATGGAAFAGEVTASGVAFAATIEAAGAAFAATTAAGGALSGAASGAASAAGAGLKLAVGAALAPETGGLSMLVGAIPGFRRGGIIPAAAGGWSLPKSFGTDRVLTGLTPGETVLPVGERPSSITESLRGMIAGMGGGDTHHYHYSPVFAGPTSAIEHDRWFQNAFKRNAGVVGDALRSNAITPRTL